MGTVARPIKASGGTAFVDGSIPVADDFNGDADTIFDEFNGNVDDNNVKVGANISGTKISPTFGSSVRVPNNVPFQVRNAGNTDYIDAINVNGSDVVQLAPGGQAGSFTGSLGVAGLITADGGLTVPGGQNLIVTDVPTVGTEAANKTYVDAEVSSGVSGGVIPPGTVMCFFQASAPTGWTKVVTQNDKVLRVVSGAGGGSGGQWDQSQGLTESAIGTGVTTANTGLAIADIPAHTHFVANGDTENSVGIDGSLSLAMISANAANDDYTLRGTATAPLRGISSATGSGNTHGHVINDPGHQHSITSSSVWRPLHIDVILCSRD